VTNTAPFPGGSAEAVACNQGAPPAPVTYLGDNGSATDTCSGTLTETAPSTCTAGTRFTDQVNASGTDADPCTATPCQDPPGPFNGLPATGSTTNAPLVTPPNCDDNLFCTDDSCTEGVCGHTPHVCNDNNLCTTDTCDEETDGCLFAPVVCASDNNLCTTEACNPANGLCESGPPTPCASDNLACNGPETCDPATGTCVSGPPVICESDNNACNGPETCVEPKGTCESGPPLDCNDNNACTKDACDPATGCTHSEIDCNDNNACTSDACDPATGGTHSEIDCNDNNACTSDACDPATGCTHSEIDCNDNNACTSDACDPATGCQHSTVTCADPVCTACNPATGSCDPLPEPPASCVELPGRMTGGGSVFTKGGKRVTHGFELHCDAEVGPNNLEINWPTGNNFHLESLTSATCTDDPAIEPPPPDAGFDTYVGTGVGRCNGVSGALITFTLTDAGEPGKFDTATFEITGCPGGLTLSVSGHLHKGNQQAHAH
jgi:Dictyostelium (slime mold) repeat